jgi:catechol 1,2-dioxygenase
VFTSGPDGGYWLKSVKPRWYPIPDDGPVGKLLRATGRHPNRPAHGKRDATPLCGEA